MQKINWKSLIPAIILAALAFTLIDGLIHYFVEALEVYYYPIPSFLQSISTWPLFWYAVAKFFATIVLSLIILPFLLRRKWKFGVKVLAYAFIIIALLEIRYLISGYYGSEWHIYNTIMHFIVLFVSSWAIFKAFKIE